MLSVAIAFAVIFLPHVWMTAVFIWLWRSMREDGDPVVRPGGGGQAVPNAVERPEPSDRAPRVWRPAAPRRPRRGPHRGGPAGGPSGGGAARAPVRAPARFVRAVARS